MALPPLLPFPEAVEAPVPFLELADFGGDWDFLLPLPLPALSLLPFVLPRPGEAAACLPPLPGEPGAVFGGDPDVDCFLEPALVELRLVGDRPVLPPDGGDFPDMLAAVRGGGRSNWWGREMDVGGEGQ